MSPYLQGHIDTPTPQTEPLDDRMIANNAGGYSYPVDDAVRMHRFLIIGSEDGSYYQKERDLTCDNTKAVQQHIAAAGVEAVNHIVEVSQSRRAPKVAPTLYCLAIAAAAEDKDTRQAALEALPLVANTASHLEEFAGYISSMRGWGRSLRNAVARWYTEKEASQVAFQAIKYRTRAGWSHRDILRKAHPQVEKESDMWHAFEWITHGTVPPDREPLKVIHSFLAAQSETNPDRLAELITRDGLPREAIPPAMLQNNQIWSALGHQMPPLAFVRNLPTLTSHNAIRPMDCQWAVDQLTNMRATTDDQGRSKPAPVHPMNILMAMMVYRMGHSVNGKNTWSPIPQIVGALDEAFDLSFSATPQTGKRVYLAVDVSGSMDWHTLGRINGLTARMAAAAVTMAIARREPNYYMTACSNKIEEYHVTARDSLQEVMSRAGAMHMGSTDMSLPMRHAMEQNIPVDCFIIATDGETWAGPVHPKEALRQYRDKTGIPAKAVQLAFVSNRHSIMDPEDAGTLDIPGFDAATTAILHDFMTD